MNPDVAADLKDLSATLGNVEAVMDLDGLRTAIGELESQATKPDLWDDPESAQKVTSQLSHQQGELRRVEELRSRLDDLPVLYELAEDEGTTRASRRRTPNAPASAATSPRSRCARCCPASTTSATRW